MNMTPQHIVSFMALAAVMSVTPGPNNFMVLSSSIRFGARQTLGHILGASTGSAFMLLLVGLGLHEIFISSPYTQEGMKYAGSAYILYLAWKMLRDTGNYQTSNNDHPMGFLGAAIFQWVNPKSWIMASVAISTCLPSVFSFIDIAFYTMMFIVISFPCVGVWAWFGSIIKRYLTNAFLVKIFNLVCAVLLAVSALSMANL